MLHGSDYGQFRCIDGEKFKNATPRSLDALSATVHLKNIFVGFLLPLPKLHFEQDGSSIVTN
jgi:hypothetical protein